MARRTVYTAVALGLLAGAVSPALAAPPNPVTTKYDAVAPLPFPTSQAGLSHGCEEGTEAVSKHTERFTFPTTGTLLLELTGYTADWDLILLDDKGKFITESAGDETTTKEKITWKKGKKGQTVQVVACNWAGGPVANGTITFTPSK